MGDAPWAPPSDEELLGRIQATDTGQLRSTAATLTRVANEFDRTSQQVRGIKIAIAGCWSSSPGGSYESFAHYTTTLSARLDDTQEALREIADHLTNHAATTDHAQTAIIAAEGLLNAGKYGNQTSNHNETSHITNSAINDFHTSEQKTRTALWQLGETAPGKIPLPLAMPQPHQNWWQNLFFPTHDGEQYWLDGRIDYHQPETVFDPSHPIYGYDEDGHKVPAFEAIPMRRHYDEDGIPISGALKLLKLSLESLRTTDKATRAIVKIITDSDGWNPGHINPKIREFYRLDDWELAVRKENPVSDGNLRPINPAYRAEFSQLIARAVLKSNRVVEYWSGETKTIAIMYNDPDTNQLLLVQFKVNPESGKINFVQAMKPNPSKIESFVAKRSIIK